MDDNDNNLEKALKNVGKKIVNVLKPVLIKAALIIGACAIILVVLAIIVYIILEDLGEWTDAYMTSSSVQAEYNGAEIVISDEQIQGLKDAIEETGISIDNWNLTDDDLKKIYAAEVVTSEINRVGYGDREEDGKYYGRVYVRYTNPDKNTTSQMYYMQYSEFEEYAASMNGDYYFSIDENDQLCVVVAETDEEGNTVNTIKHLDYKTSLSAYLTPVEFLLDLCYITNNPEFVLALADKIINETEIWITVLNETTTVETTTTETYQIQTITWTSTRDDRTIDEEECTITDGEQQTETTTSQNITVTPSVKTIKVRTWYMEQTCTYNKVTSDPETQDLGTQSLPDEDFDNLVASGSYRDTMIVATGSRKINQQITITSATTKITYPEGVTVDPEYFFDDFWELLNTPFMTPSGFSLSAYSGLSGAEEWFLNMLQSSERTQTVEQIMRYVLYTYTGESYGVTELTLSTYNSESFTIIYSGVEGSTVAEKVWYALKNLGYSDEAVAGAMGNIYCESRFSPTALFGETGAYGLAQWLGARRVGLQNYAASKGTTKDNVDIQIEFLIAELTGQGDAKEFATRRTSGGNGENYHTYSDWANATTVEEAAVAYCWFFETPSLSYERTEGTKAIEAERIAAAQDYYEMYGGKSAGGTYTQTSSSSGIVGYYTSAAGRTFTIFNQTKITGWEGKCNRAACAIIASGYSTSTNLVEEINNAKRTLFNAIPAQGSSYWTGYGLDVTYSVDVPRTYTYKLKEQLMSGGYALLYLNNNESTYKGKSGTVWTSEQHWVAILDYRNVDGTDEMCVADWRGITWVGLDEFDTHGVSHMIFVNEI